MPVATGTPCCKGGRCQPGEVVWRDDFESYTEGENLTPYGYIGAAAPTAVSGECQNRPAVQSGSFVWRVRPFDNYVTDEIRFFCNVETVDTAIVLVLGQIASGLGSFLASYAGMRFDASGNITCSIWRGPDFTPTATASPGDVLELKATKTAYTDITMTLLVEFSHQSVLVHSDSVTLTLGEDIGNGFELNFCTMGYGIYGGPSPSGFGLSDNWNMVATDPPDPPVCNRFTLFVCPVSGFVFEVIDSVVSAGEVTHRVKVTCDPPGIAEDEFYVTLPCDELSCRTVDLSLLNLVPCGSPGIVSLGNDASCC